MTTFTFYYIGFAMGILIWGILSDVYGRKRIIQIGALLYVISSLLCPLSHNLPELVLARFGQGVGDAACATVAAAMVRDCYSGPQLLRIMASLGSMALLAPIIAPIVGIILISWSHQWQYIFHFLTAYGIILLICSQIIPETMAKETKISGVMHAFKYYYLHGQNLSFILFSLASAFICGAVLSFVGISAVIYLKIFHLTKWEYGLFFAINGLMIILANSTIKKLADVVQPLLITKVSISCSAIVLLTGYCLMSIYAHSVILFLLTMSLTTYFMSLCANTTGAAAMQSVSESFGTAVSIKNFVAIFCGGIANYTITKFSYAYLSTDLILQQFVFLVLATVIILPKLSKPDST